MKLSRLSVYPLIFAAALALGGEYSLGVGGFGSAVDEPIPGFTGPEGDGIIPNGYYDDEGNYVYIEGEGSNTINPAFIGWATRVVDYSPANESKIDAAWKNTALALGPATGDNYDIVSLGDLSAADIANGMSPGSITLAFDVKIKNGDGADFAVFENSLIGMYDFGTGDLPEYAGVFLELAYVEVSTDGEHFARFPCVSNNEQFDPDSFETPAAYVRARAYANRDATNVYNLAGKHVNNGGESWGTPFDLEDLKDDPLVLSGVVDLDDIRYVRIVDIPGSGDYLDSNGHPIYDPWVTYGSGGFDLEAVGVLNGEVVSYDNFEEWAAAKIPDEGARGVSDDPDGDGLPNLLEYALGKNPLLPDGAGAVSAEMTDGRLAIVFERPETCAGVFYAVEAFDDLIQAGTVIAEGGDTIETTGDAVVEQETLENGHVRVRVEDAAEASSGNPRFLRLKITTLD